MTLTQHILLLPIRFYRRCVSPLFPPCCRFYPSCSAYAMEAIIIHGPVKGMWLTVKRLLRCHPGHPGGFDPVPPFAPSTAFRAGFWKKHG